ncbi:MAG: DUF4124 domain-containing protein [Gammaproteobacteria bacterium]
MKNVWKYLIGLSMTLLLVSSVHAATYKYQDEQGQTVYAQQPPASGPYEVIGSPKVDRYNTGSRTDSPAADTSTQPSLQERASKIDDKNKADKALASEMEKNKKLREENCATARKNLEVYTVYRRFKDEAGNVTRMTDAEREKNLAEARDAIRQFCD